MNNIKLYTSKLTDSTVNTIISKLTNANCTLSVNKQSGHIRSLYIRNTNEDNIHSILSKDTDMLKYNAFKEHLVMEAL